MEVRGGGMRRNRERRWRGGFRLEKVRPAETWDQLLRTKQAAATGATAAETSKVSERLKHFS